MSKLVLILEFEFMKLLVSFFLPQAWSLSQAIDGFLHMPYGVGLDNVHFDHYWRWGHKDCVIFMDVCIEEGTRNIDTQPCCVWRAGQTEHQSPKWSIEIRCCCGVFSPCSEVAANHQSTFVLVVLLVCVIFTLLNLSTGFEDECHLTR